MVVPLTRMLQNKSEGGGVHRDREESEGVGCECE